MSAEALTEHFGAYPAQVSEIEKLVEVLEPKLAHVENPYAVAGSVSRVALSAEGVTEPPLTKQELVDSVTENLHTATSDWLSAVNTYPIYEPPVGQRDTTVKVVAVEADAQLPTSWQPSQTNVYSSSDPFQLLNPVITEATTTFINAAINEVDRLKTTRDPALTYLNLNRNLRDRKPTLPTQIIKDSDEGIAYWVSRLPQASQLRPVANPWSDVPTIIHQDGEIQYVPTSTPLQALVGGGGDGRAVREREALERELISKAIEKVELPGNRLVITSLGTGTGEPAMDAALSAMRETYGASEYTVEIHGFDIDDDSLAVADHVARHKHENLRFFGKNANILTEEGIKQVIEDTQPQIIEAIGFAEYMPSDNAPDESERIQRAKMKRMGCMSAQDFYGKIYENMPKGSVLISGNMRNDSPQAPFVVDAIGWQGIIQRSTPDYLRILREAGIPGDAVELYTPDENDSAGVYNIVAITKL